MIAMTTRSSTSVNARRTGRIAFVMGIASGSDGLEKDTEERE
jgi:hypothetical protein